MPRARVRRLLTRAAAAALAVLALPLLAGCSTQDLPSFAMPRERTTDQHDRILLLWQGSWIAALAVGALVWGLILWCAVAYRRSRHDEGYLPPQTRYNLPIEVFYTIVPFLMISVLFFFTARDEEKILVAGTNPQHTVNVTAIQWSWQFEYDDGGPAKTVTGTPAAPPTLVLPEGESVRFVLRSDDVIHSFFVPAFVFKLDVIPGRTNTFEITPTKQGRYFGKCTELCGRDHSRMLFNVEVVSPERYQSYVAGLQEGQVR